MAPENKNEMLFMENNIQQPQSLLREDGKFLSLIGGASSTH